MTSEDRRRRRNAPPGSGTNRTSGVRPERGRMGSETVPNISAGSRRRATRDSTRGSARGSVHAAVDGTAALNLAPDLSPAAAPEVAVAPASRVDERPAADHVAPPAPVRVAKAHFVLIVLGLIAAGIVGQLLLSTKINENSFELHQLRQQQAATAARQQQLEQELAVKEAPGNLAAEARRQGMVAPSGNPAYLRMPDGRVIGEQPANGRTGSASGSTGSTNGRAGSAAGSAAGRGAGQPANGNGGPPAGR